MAKKKFAWEPQGAYLDSRIARFMHTYGIPSWQKLIRRSTQDIEWFTPYRTLYDDSRGMPWMC